MEARAYPRAVSTSRSSVPDPATGEGRAISSCSCDERGLYSFFIRMLQEDDMGRVKVNLTLDAEVAQSARSLGLNMSRLAEAAIVQAAKAERNRVWREENQAAIDAYAKEVADDGLPLARFRSF